LFDKYDAPFVSFFAAFLLGISLARFSISLEINIFLQSIFHTESWFIPFLIITFLFFCIRFCGQGVLTISSRKMIMMWFDKNHGKMNSISSITVSLGFSSSPILINKLIDDSRWENELENNGSLFIVRFLRLSCIEINQKILI
jgi:OFA family oxalate/formate antiporter-like MFS transporter